MATSLKNGDRTTQTDDKDADAIVESCKAHRQRSTSRSSATALSLPDDAHRSPRLMSSSSLHTACSSLKSVVNSVREVIKTQPQGRLKIEQKKCNVI